MQKTKNGRLIYSASDLVNYLLCPSVTAYDIQNLESPLQKTPDDDYVKILQQKGFEHENNYFEELSQNFPNVVDIASSSKNSNETALKDTRKALESGMDIIFQAFLKDEDRIGHIDFLRKVDKPSVLGAYSYEVIDTKLAKSATPKFIIQLCFYSDLLQRFQGELPENIHLKLGDGSYQSFRLKEYYAYYSSVLSRFKKFITKPDSHSPEPCSHCVYCSWRDLCNGKWRQEDHLSQVANIGKDQRKKLVQAGVTTLQDLATAPPDTKIPTLHANTFETLRKQASLQLRKRKTLQNHYEILPVDPLSQRGFNRLPEPAEGDLFFDMEGDPLEEGGLEYLFGLYYFETGMPVFKDFWAHDRQQEKKSFEQFIDFIWDHLNKYPLAHIYHYAHYEESALKKLMSLHGTREWQVDELLRHNKLVDLYKVVKEGIMISESGYSIKNLETFYMEARQSEVVNAVGSIIYYEKWKLTGDNEALESIRKYNEDDCRSTFLLYEWLLAIQPESARQLEESEMGEIGGSGKFQSVSDYEELLADMVAALTCNLPEDRDSWDKSDKLKKLTSQLLDFYRRSDKPAWWGIFSRKDMSEAELIDDPECIGSLEQVEQPYSEGRSYVYTYKFPNQEFKFQEGKGCTLAETGENISKISKLDSDQNIISLKSSVRKAPLPARLSIGPTPPINNNVLKIAIFRFAQSVVNEDHQNYKAVKDILSRNDPEIIGKKPSAPIIDKNKDIIAETINAVMNLNNSYLTIQGPPGAGKTYMASRIILSLILDNKRIAVSSNSHKAINNLLSAVESHANEQGVTINGSKKSSRGNEDSCLNGSMIRDVYSNDDAYGDIVGATAWYFARDENNQTFDYLFIDEAGQVSLANIVAMGLSAKNIILLGDQMQLGQPIQGIHPGNSGSSALDFLMEGHSTVPENKGVFLPTTYRMHPDVSSFISQVFYEDRLSAEIQNIKQKLILQEGHNVHLSETGIRFIAADHDGCSQSSPEEVKVVNELVSDLLRHSFRCKKGHIHRVTLENILVVAPYNMQVNLLKKELPEGARVGTVDKFQGQEAEVVIISMTTSSGEYLPRFIDFLFSRQRLNVAISRARCLSIIIANPKLLEVPCKTVKQMAMVNTLCQAYLDGTKS